MPFLELDGRRLHYLTRGAGVPVVLLHGLGSSGADWAFQAPALQERFRVIVPDLPGCGHSPAPDHPYSVPAWADATWALLDALGVDQPNLIGFSMGGAVALEMALQRPGRVPRLGLINSLASYRVDHWTKWCKARVDAGLVRLLGIRRTAQLIAARLFPHPAQAPMRERAATVIGAVPANTYLAMARALERWSALGRLDALTSRTLIIAAEHDYTPLAEKRALAARIGGTLIVVRESRHGTPFDAVEITNASLLALLNDAALPGEARWHRDDPALPPPVSLVRSLADEHAAVPRADPGVPLITSAVQASDPAARGAVDG
jgi:pimeloyl-ACP methyl ester carboxylesterase